MPGALALSSGYPADGVETRPHVLRLVGFEWLIVHSDQGSHGYAPYVEPLAPGLLVDDAVAVVHEAGLLCPNHPVR